MSVLKLSLKKDVFEGINSQTLNEILIDKTNWWRKRLVDQDTGRFRDFDYVEISSGNSGKFSYPLLDIREESEKFVVTVKFMDGHEDESEEGVVEPEPITKPEPEPVVEPEPIPEQNVESLSSMMKKMLDDFCTRGNVYGLTSDRVVIRRSGQIVGTNKFIYTASDTDVIIEFRKYEFIKYYNEMDNVEFVNYVRNFLNSYAEQGYVFIKTDACCMANAQTGEDMFILVFTTRKKYRMRNL